MKNKEKTCRDCLETKNIDYFVTNMVFKDNKDTLCKPCNRKRVKADRLKTKRNHNGPNSKKLQSSTIYREIIIDFLVRRDGFICGICNKTLEGAKIHFDHMMPQALGGLHVMENIQLTHMECNLKNSMEIRQASAGY